MKSLAQELEEKTQAYWNTSKVFFAGVGVPMTMSEAIEQCNRTAEVLGPHRPLKYRVWLLQDKLIQGRGKRRKTSSVPNNVRYLFG